MLSIAHITPTTLNEALELLSQQNGESHVIAGGSDLVLNMRNGLVAPKTLINIKCLQELKGITYDKHKGICIGALTTLREIHRSPIIQSHYPALSFAASKMASEQIRAFATVGGNLCNGSPSADQSVPLIALGATANLISLRGGREIPLEEFFIGPGETALTHDELLWEITVPLPQGKTIFTNHTPRIYMDISVVCIALRLVMAGNVCQESRIVLGAVAPTPMRARNAESILDGQILNPHTISDAAMAAADESKPIDDAKGTAWYRKKMVEVLVQRGISTFLPEQSR
jgi:carbon-monoxide dehydrogenase medium subunit